MMYNTMNSQPLVITRPVSDMAKDINALGGKMDRFHFNMVDFRTTLNELKTSVNELKISSRNVEKKLEAIANAVAKPASADAGPSSPPAKRTHQNLDDSQDSLIQGR